MRTVEAALFIAENVGRVALREDAGRCLTDVLKIRDDIERLINRPQPDRLLGPCPATVGHLHDKRCDQSHPHVCGIALSAKHDATEVSCVCGAHYDIDRLLEQQVDEAAEMSFTLSELYKTILPAKRVYVPLRTLQHWAATSRLFPTGYTAQAEPRFQLSDVLKLHEAKKQTSTTGAAAHKNRQTA